MMIKTKAKSECFVGLFSGQAYQLLHPTTYVRKIPVLQSSRVAMICLREYFLKANFSWKIFPFSFLYLYNYGFIRFYILISTFFLVWRLAIF